MFNFVVTGSYARHLCGWLIVAQLFAVGLSPVVCPAMQSAGGELSMDCHGAGQTIQTVPVTEDTAACTCCDSCMISLSALFERPVTPAYVALDTRYQVPQDQAAPARHHLSFSYYSRGPPALSFA